VQNSGASSEKLDASIGNTLNLMNEYTRDNKQLTESMLTQFEIIGTLVAKVTDRINESVEKIPKAVENQTAIVKQTTSVINIMNDEINEMTKNSVMTNDYAKQLAATAVESREIILNSQKNMELISKNTKFINELLQAMEDVTAKTNLLSMNASIEAAHAGDRGRGFSVVASEIRGLADKSRKTLTESFNNIKAMTVTVGQGIDLSNQVTSKLLTIIENSGKSSQMIDAITDNMKRQQEESESIRSGMIKLLENTNQIHVLTETEQKENMEILDSLSKLREFFKQISEMVTKQAQSSKTITESVYSINSIMDDNKKNLELLRETTGKIAGNK
jgi:methyl-accepting chemotaxis protein